MSGDIPDDLERLGQALGQARAAQVSMARGRARLSARMRTADATVAAGATTGLPERVVSATSSRQSRRFARWHVGAGLSLLLLIGAVASLWTHWSANTPVASARYATQDGERKTVTLSDGSRVTLAPYSELVATADFGHHNRTVMLRGHAMFRVASHAGAPFVVQTGAVHTRVLGTDFDIVHDPGTHRVRIAVLAGRVAFGVRGSTVLESGTVAVATDSTLSIQSNTDVSAYGEWPTGHLRFHEAPVSEVLASVGRWYGVEFRLQDSAAAAERVNATFNYQTRQDALIAIKTLLHVDMIFDGNVVILRPRHTSSPAPYPRRNGRDDFSHSTEVGR